MAAWVDDAFMTNCSEGLTTHSEDLSVAFVSLRVGLLLGEHPRGGGVGGGRAGQRQLRPLCVTFAARLHSPDPTRRPSTR